MNEMNVTFWGVVGSCPGANRSISEYGIATPCVEVRVDDLIIVLDCGTGVVPLGRKLNDERPLDLHMFITHTHWDHVLGMPFFSQAYMPENKMHIYGLKRENITLEQVFRGLMAYPYFPVGWETMKADIQFVELNPYDVVELSENCRVESFPTSHPGGNLAYAIYGNGKKMVYMTDLDHSKMDDASMIEFVKDADLMIYDANFTQEEYEMDRYAGWGHSTWEFGRDLAKRTGVKHLSIFHHGVQRKKEEMHELETVLYQENMHISVAREGMTLRL